MGQCTIDQNGFRRQRANPVSRVGVFPYTGEQIDYDGSLGLEKDKIYWVYRGPEELFAQEALESFNGIPIRLGHIMLGKGFKSVDEEPADGCIFNVRPSMDMPDVLIAEFAIWTEKLKDVLTKGKIKQLSLGYRCQYVPEMGMWNGIPYQFKQINLRGNHLALVEHGRCGSSVCVCDQAIITFDSLPEEIQQMNDEAKKVEKAKRLAEAVKNCDEQACQDCLDFYDLSPEQRKDALAYVKSKAAKPSETPANDGCGGGKAKDEVPPPPPNLNEQQNNEQKPTEGGTAAAKPEEKPNDAKPTVTPPAEGTAAPSEKPNDEQKPGTGDAQPTVTEPTAQVPVQKLQGGAEETPPTKTEDEIPAGAGAGATPPPVKPTVPPDNGNTAEQPKTEGSLASKPEMGSERDINVAPTKTEDENNINPPNQPNSAKQPDQNDGLPHKEEPPAPDQHINPKPNTAEDGKPAGHKCCDGGCKDPNGDGVCDSCGAPMPKAEENNPKATAQDEAAQYAKFAAEYSRAQLLAEQVRPMVGTFDSSLMTEVQVARYAAKHIDCLAFACDDADAVVLAAVKGHVAARAKAQSKAKPKTFAVAGDSALPGQTQPQQTLSAKAALDKFYSKK